MSRNRIEHTSENVSELETIKAVNWDNFTFIDLFAGIGGIRLGFGSVGGKCVFSSEIDEDAVKMYEANFGEQPCGDITQIPPETVPNHDILLAGFPCQPFSIIGNRKGFADIRGTLFFNIAEILKTKRPVAILLENVKQFRTHDNGRTYRAVIEVLESLGYYTNTAILNALDYGVPQKRERTFIVGFLADLEFDFPMPNKNPPDLKSIFEPDENVDPKLFASPEIREKRLARLKKQGRNPFYPSMWHENKGGHIGMHPFSCALRANASYNYLLVNGYRRPSSRECLRFQGFPDSFQMVVNHTAIRKLAGNSVAVPVIKAVAGQMIASLKQAKLRNKEVYLFSDMQETSYSSV
jgi:DNA (cytosine-5)-methyltransferase 1